MIADTTRLPLHTRDIANVDDVFDPVLPRTFTGMLTSGKFLVVTGPSIKRLTAVHSTLFSDIHRRSSSGFLRRLTPCFALVRARHIDAGVALSTSSLTSLLAVAPCTCHTHDRGERTLLTTIRRRTFDARTGFIICILRGDTSG